MDLGQCLGRSRLAERSKLAGLRGENSGSAGPISQRSCDKHLVLLSVAPQDSGKLVILLQVSGQTSPADVAWLDDIALYSLE
jgi:hypothetical protein